jgi:hypothetical protein
MSHSGPKGVNPSSIWILCSLLYKPCNNGIFISTHSSNSNPCQTTPSNLLPSIFIMPCSANSQSTCSTDPFHYSHLHLTNRSFQNTLSQQECNQAASLLPNVGNTLNLISYPFFLFFFFFFFLKLFIYTRAHRQASHYLRNTNSRKMQRCGHNTVAVVTW